jgi:hypothetical protein
LRDHDKPLGKGAIKEGQVHVAGRSAGGVHKQREGGRGDYVPARQGWPGVPMYPLLKAAVVQLLQNSLAKVDIDLRMTLYN